MPPPYLDRSSYRRDQLAAVGTAATTVAVWAIILHLIRRTRRWYKAAIPASLSEGKVFLLEWPMCTLYMMNDRQYPAWIMMVPRKVRQHWLHVYGNPIWAGCTSDANMRATPLTGCTVARVHCSTHQ